MNKTDISFCIAWSACCPKTEHDQGRVLYRSGVFWTDGDNIEEACLERQLPDRVAEELKRETALKSGSYMLKESAAYGPILRSPEHDLFVRVRDYITENIGIKDVGSKTRKEFGLTEKTLCRLFKSEMDMNFSNFIIKTRVHLARVIMINEGITAVDAADRVGYRSYSGFYRAYLNEFGRPPSENGQVQKGPVYSEVTAK